MSDETLQAFLRFFGHGFCHQLPSRSFEVGGVFFSACARDTGIYLGFFFALIAAVVIYAHRATKPAELPPIAWLIILALFIVPMAFDGITSYLGIRPTTNTIRYITGFLAGVAAGSILTPLLFALHKNANPGEHIFARPRTIGLHLALTVALGTAFFLTFPFLGFLAPLIPLVGFLTLVVCINLVLLTLSKRFAPRHTAKHWLLLLALALLLALIEITLFGFARDLIVHFVLGGRELSEFLT